MRIFRTVKPIWVLRGVLVLLGAAAYFGYPLDWRSTLGLMTTLEVDILNRGGDPILFGLAIGLIFAFWILPDIWRVARRQLAHWEIIDQTQWQVLHEALFWIVDQSAWMRWFEAQRAAEKPRELNELQKLCLAEGVLRDKARSGEVIIRGRLSEQFDYEPIPADFWRSVFIHFERDDHTLWKVVLMPGNERGLPTIPEIPDYATLEVNENKIKELWPAKDKNLDQRTRKLLKQVGKGNGA